MENLLIIGIGVVVCGFWYVSKQLSSLILLYKNKSQLEWNENNLLEEGNDVAKLRGYYTEDRYKKEEDYTDRLSEWLGSNPTSSCIGECKDGYGLSVSGELLQKGQNKGELEKSYSIVFTGKMWAYFGHLPDKQVVCAFTFMIHFGCNKQSKEPFIGAFQDSYCDVIEDTHYYEGRHTMHIECYESIDELEKYKLLIASGKKLGCRVFFDVCPQKIKMDGSKIVKCYTENIGKLRGYHIFKIEN